MKIYHRLILVIFTSVVASQNSPYTIQSLAAYSLQRNCVQNCISPGNLPINVGCPDLNACVCRTDIQPTVSQYMTSCVNQGCNTNPPDLSSAISLYDGYCVSNGFVVAGTPATTTEAVTSLVTSLAIVSKGTTATAVVTSTAGFTTTLSSTELPLESSSTSTSSSTTTSISATPTSTNPTLTTSTSTTSSISGAPIPISTAGQPAHSSNVGAIVGGLIGALACIAIIAGIIFFFIHSKKKRAALGSSQQMRQEVGYEPDGLHPAQHYVQPHQRTTAGPPGSPSPPYVHIASPYPDLKTVPEVNVHEAAGSSLVSPIESPYEVSGEHYKA